MNSAIDLRQLAVERSPSRPTLAPKRGAWFTRWVLPIAIVLAFAGIVLWTARDRWLPAKPVTITSVVMSKAEVRQAGTPLFQAAGWIEPRPTAVMCSALVEGVVEQLLVIEGQEVKVGQPVAKLVDAEVKLAVREAESSQQLREAEREIARANLDGAQKNFDQPVHLEAALAEAEATCATLETEIKNLPFLIKSAEARLLLAKQDLDGKRAVGDGIAGRLIQKAQSEFDAATATLADLEQRGPNLSKQKEAWTKKCEALQTRLTLKTEEMRALDEAKAKVSAAEAQLELARLAVESAKLKLDRMTIRAPIKGKILALNAQPGRRLMGLNIASERDASTVVTLYDPDRLQVRADVRLENVSQVQIGQPVQISTAAAKDPFKGQVLAMTSQADVQKNTLQVKVSIDNPLRVIRPEMLAEVTFIAPPQLTAEIDGQKEEIRLLVPKALVQKSEGGAWVWAIDPSSDIARKRTIQLGRADTKDLVEVVQGLSALDKLVVSGREALTEGDRVRITGDDPSLGKENEVIAK
jgi:HlyD family secretion protein